MILFFFLLSFFFCKKVILQKDFWLVKTITIAFSISNMIFGLMMWWGNGKPHNNQSTKLLTIYSVVQSPVRPAVLSILTLCGENRKKKYKFLRCWSIFSPDSMKPSGNFHLEFSLLAVCLFLVVSFSFYFLFHYSNRLNTNRSLFLSYEFSTY